MADAGKEHPFGCAIMILAAGLALAAVILALGTVLNGGLGP